MKSTDDNRVVNNVMRHNYRPLTDAEKEQMQTLLLKQKLKKL